jgi:NtrC-family two-component system sensor histidine kinase KinB
MEHPQHAHIVIGADGMVLAASGPLPPGLVDSRLEECDGLPREIRDVGEALLHELHGSSDRVVSRTVPLDGEGRSLELVAIEALALRRTPTDVAGLLTSKLAVISFQAASVDVTLTVEVHLDVPDRVHLDSEKLAWAVTTLVGNALRYMRSGSSRLSGRTIGVTTSYDRATAEIAVEVRDDGPGIPQDTVARLFKRDGLNVRGAGLALVLISDIVAAHGGRVEVRSRTDAAEHGTTIRLTFPVG